MLTHLPDTGIPRPRCLGARAGGLAGQAPQWGSETLWGPSKGQAFFPECFKFQRLKRSRWAFPLPLLLYPAALEISGGDCLLLISIWVAGRILGKPP